MERLCESRADGWRAVAKVRGRAVPAQPEMRDSDVSSQGAAARSSRGAGPAPARGSDRPAQQISGVIVKPQTESQLLKRKHVIIADMRQKIDAEDWHGVADAAMDLREVDAALSTLEAIRDGHVEVRGASNG